MRAPMRRTDFNFDLPDALIARHPAPERSGSRLLHLAGATGALTDRQFRDLPGFVKHISREHTVLIYGDAIRDFEILSEVLGLECLVF